MKRIIAMICALAMLLSMTVYAGNKKPLISADTVTAEPGATVKVPVRISGNPGMIGAKITVSYAKGLTLTEISAGEAFAALTMTAPGDKKANPVNILWDAMDIDDQDVKDGVIATLSFTAPEEAGTYAITLSTEKRDNLDRNMKSVDVACAAGSVTVGEGNQTTIKADDVFAVSGGRVEVPLRISGNPGMIGAKITVSYAKGLTLTEISAGEAFAALTMTAPGDKKANPVNILWDAMDIDDQDVKDGVIATLSFTAPEEAGTYAITLSTEKRDNLDRNMKSVDVACAAGSVTVGSTVPDALSGKVQSYDPNVAATVKLMQGEEVKYTVTTDTSTGSGQTTQTFRFETVEPGTYDLVVSKSAHLGYTVKGVVISGGDLDLTQHEKAEIAAITLPAGDVNGDGTINSEDLNMVWKPSNYLKGADTAENAITDVNGDGTINSEDLNVIWMPANYLKDQKNCTTDF